MSSKSGGAKASRKEDGIKIVSDNRRARYDYEILQAFEAGIELKGSEVKSLRTGHTNLAEAYATMKGGELWLINSNIPEYREANRFNHEPKRPRKLLLHEREIAKFTGAVERKGPDAKWAAPDGGASWAARDAGDGGGSATAGPGRKPDTARYSTAVITSFSPHTVPTTVIRRDQVKRLRQLSASAAPVARGVVQGEHGPGGGGLGNGIRLRRASSQANSASV